MWRTQGLRAGGGCATRVGTGKVKLHARPASDRGVEVANYHYRTANPSLTALLDPVCVARIYAHSARNLTHQRLAEQGCLLDHNLRAPIGHLLVENEFTRGCWAVLLLVSLYSCLCTVLPMRMR